MATTHPTTDSAAAMTGPPSPVARDPPAPAASSPPLGGTSAPSEQDQQVADLEAALMGTSKMRFGKNSQHNEVLADAFKKKLDAQEKAAKQRARDNDSTATMSLKLMLEVWNNELLKQVWRTTPFWLTVACFAIGFFLGGGPGPGMAKLMDGLGFVTIFFLTWYLGKMWDRRTTVRTAVDDVTGCMQAIPMLARTTDMSFAHQVQLWRYISCAIVTSFNATCGVKYTDEFNYAENMINMHHLMTPQESQVLEIWRPNSTYCRLEFMVQAMNVLASARRNDQLSDVLEVDLRQNILKLRGLLGGIGYLIEAEPPFGARQMVGFVVLLYNMFYAFTRGVATYEAFATTSVVETIDFELADKSCGDLAGEILGDVCTRSMTTSVNTTAYAPEMLIMGFINFFVVANCFFGILQMCDQLRDITGDGPMSVEIMPAVNGCINKGKQICYFGEVYQYDADSKRLSTDIIGDEILENMYKRGFLNKEDNETKWNLGDKRNSWRTRALECLTEEMMKDGVAGVEELFKSADKDGSGELDTAEVRSLFLQKDPNFPAADLDFLMARLDPDRSGSVSWAEFQRTVVSGAEVLEFVNEFHNETKLHKTEQEHTEGAFVSKGRKGRRNTMELTQAASIAHGLKGWMNKSTKSMDV
ncbi:hypothetical protein TeGR_g246 [Tetraparma gracilis]|uniref:EF-hand domain-containing protein n=1 Tax=Tetraparma gracilis TaxID=2962635 RepID=A0ABQ6MN01_9STRA|nr:hypothetical protein TeGR_g246 [Tetraparma gracilis]